MSGWDTVLAAIGGLLLGAGLASLVSIQRERRWARQKLELGARLRRLVIPVLERRADMLGIPTAERGEDADGPIELTIDLANAIRGVEESGELPFGDTLEVSRKELSVGLARREKDSA